MPKLTVDGLELDVPQGATVLQAGELASAKMLEAAE
jgi:NADH dehydrogenase/NADH:ubiquinone oxidoreductase subunit G